MDGYYSKPMYALVTFWTGKGIPWNEPNETTVTGITNSMEMNYVRVWQFK